MAVNISEECKEIRQETLPTKISYIQHLILHDEQFADLIISSIISSCKTFDYIIFCYY